MEALSTSAEFTQEVEQYPRLLEELASDAELGAEDIGGLEACDSPPPVAYPSPVKRLADAVITQAFRDLVRTDKSADGSVHESARAFLLGETAEGSRARVTYCEILALNPLFIERMANQALAVKHKVRLRRKRSGRAVSRRLPKRQQVIAGGA